MNKKNLLILTFASMTMITSTTIAQKKQPNQNPFFEKYNTPYNVPAFDKIKVAYFKPAFLEGIKQQEKEKNEKKILILKLLNIFLMPLSKSF